jgi:hypothetical protein
MNGTNLAPSRDRLLEPVRSAIAPAGLSSRPIPNLFVVGVAKAGTTTMHSCLSQHPDVFMTEEKEPGFFATIDPRHTLAGGYRAIADTEAYLDLFREARGQRWLGESSPAYFWDEQSPSRIAAFAPDARIIILLREPVSRAYSAYLHLVRDQVERRPFLRAIREDYAHPRKGWDTSFLYVDLGFYCAPIRRFLEAFPRDRVGVFFFEEMVTDPGAFLGAVLSFLDLDPASAQGLRLERKNPHMVPRNRALAGFLRTMRGAGVWGPVRRMVPGWAREFLRDHVWFRVDRKPEMDPEARRFLADLYRGQIPELEAILGRRIPWSS